MTKARRITLTKTEKARKILDQNGRCGCGCGERLVKGSIEFDHTIAVEDRPADKPYTRAEEYQLQKALTTDCHKIKTKYEAALRAHIRRLEKEHNSQPKRKRVKKKIQSPGFDKRFKQKVDGTVVPRT